MKKYMTPTVDVTELCDVDLIATSNASFGELEELPESPDTPYADLNDNQWDGSWTE